MAQIRCKNNLHFYDPTAHHDCPHCGCGPAEKTDVADGRRKKARDNEAQEKTELGDDHLERDRETRSAAEEDGPVTRIEGGGQVVGWLVGLEGAAKGRDFRLSSGQNRIGRGVENEIVISGDPEVSAKKHAVLGYDDRANEYFLTHAEGRNLTRLNGKALRGGAADLSPYDVIEVGSTKLLFVPLCGPHFTWARGVGTAPGE
jgi:hypothetical protein